MQILDKKLERSIQSQHLKHAFLALKNYIDANNYYWSDVENIVSNYHSDANVRIVFLPNTQRSCLLFTTLCVETDRLIAEYLNSEQIVRWLQAYCRKV